MGSVVNKFIRVFVIAILVAFPLFAEAGINNPSSGSVVIPAVGNAQINLGLGEWTAQMSVNLFNGSIIALSGGATPAALDADGYPVQNFTGTVGGSLGYIDQTLATTGPWIFSWPAGRSFFKMNFFAPATITNAVHATVVNGAGSGNPSIIGDGSAGSVTINWNTTGAVNFNFDGTYAGNYASNTTGTMALYRSSDAVAFAAGEYFTPEFIAMIKNLHPRAIRPMGWNLPRASAVDSNETTWGYRRKITSFSFIEPTTNFPPGTRAGGATSFGTVSVAAGAYTAAAAADTPLGGWVNGETLTGNNASTTGVMTVTGAAANAGNVQLTVASTTGLTAGKPVKIAIVNGTTEANGLHTVLSVDSGTTFTINVAFVHAFSSSPASAVGYQSLTITGKTGGSKLIINNLGTPIGAGFTSDQNSILSGNATYVYDSVLDAVLYTSGGVSLAPPLEAQVQLANRVNANFWYNIPTWAVDDYVTNAANLVFSNLNSNLKFEVEYSNEMWNSGQYAFFWAGARATALGLTTNLDYQGLRLRQIHGNLLPASSWGTAMSRLERLYMFQGGTGFGDTSISGFMNGQNLVSPGTAAYQTFVGGSAVNYNTAPNRPIDFTDAIGYAPYAQGLGLGGQSPDAGSAPVAADAPTLQSIATNYNAGGAGITTAIALIDDMVKQGRNGVQNVTASGTTFTTPLAHGYSISDLQRFDVTGGTTYSGLNTKVLYIVDTVPTTATFTIKPIINGVIGSTVNAGSAGSGTTTVGGSGTNVFQSNFNLQSGVYTKWEAMATTLSANVGRPGTMSALKMEWYEGALEPTAPTAQQLIAVGVTDTSSTVTSVSGNSICFSSMPFNSAASGSQVAFTNVGSLTGVSTGVNYIAVNVVGNCMGVQQVGAGNPATIGGTAGGAVVVGNQGLAKAIVAWKNDPLSSAAIQAYYKSFKGLDANYITFGAMPHSVSPSQLVLMGGGVYALNANFSFVTPALYQLYNGFATFSAP